VAERLAQAAALAGRSGDKVVQDLCRPAWGPRGALGPLAAAPPHRESRQDQCKFRP